MKYLILIFLVLGGGWYFYNLGLNTNIVEQAKKDMGVIIEDKKENLKEEKEDLKQEYKNLQEENTPIYTVKKIDDKNYIKIDDLTEKVKKISDKLKITGKVLNSEVDKIIVKFSNNDSDYPDDSYQLKTFKKGNVFFEYIADSLVFQNLDYGINKYIVESYVGDDVSILELEINIPENLGEDKKSEEKSSEKTTYDKKVIGDLFIDLPESEFFGNALSLGDNIITYSNIKKLEISKDNFDKEELTSDNIWNSEGKGYINKNIKGYVYWNTFREIDYSNKNSGVSFYILRKSGDKFIYEKIYFDFKNNLKGVLKIKEILVNKEKEINDQMSELNKNLKEQNSDSEEVKKTDKLFREIVR